MPCRSGFGGGFLPAKACISLLLLSRRLQRNIRGTLPRKLLTTNSPQRYFLYSVFLFFLSNRKTMQGYSQVLDKKHSILSVLSRILPAPDSRCQLSSALSFWIRVNGVSWTVSSESSLLPSFAVRRCLHSGSASVWEKNILYTKGLFGFILSFSGFSHACTYNPVIS